MTIRLLLADDQALVRGALSALLNLESDLEVVAEVGTGDAVVPAVLEHRPDVAMLDVEMPGLDGISATAEVRRASPDTKVLIVTTFGRPGYLRRALQAGAAGFVVKDTPAAQLADAVRRVYAGLRVVDPALATDSLVAGESPLTQRETEVLRAARDGSSGGRDRQEAVPVRGHGSQPPVRGDRQDRRLEPRGGRHHRGRERLALAAYDAPVRHTVVTMTRGDADKIEEWVDYHARLGFEDFQVILDGDVDGTEHLLRSLDGRARISVHPRDEIGDYYDSMSADERRHHVAQWRDANADRLASGEMRGNDALSWRQHQQFPSVLAPYASGDRGEGWLALIDVDEFIVLEGYDSIGDVTAEATTPRLRFLNFNVDTTGYDPGRPVLEQHSMRWAREDVLAHPLRRWARRAKSVVRYDCAKLNSTVHKVSRGPHTELDPERARLHHFKMPLAADLGIPYTVDDPIRMPPRLS